MNGFCLNLKLIYILKTIFQTRYNSCKSIKNSLENFQYYQSFSGNPVNKLI